MNIKERHSRNIPALSEEEMQMIYGSRVLVVGCGGLGGNIIEQLVRIGVGFLRVADGDSFSPSNLNRQLLSNSNNLGMNKAFAAAEHVRAIDPDITIEAVGEFFTKENAATLMADVDIVMDALDNVESRLLLEDAASEADLTIIHGAISGWDLQAMVIRPGSGLLHQLYYKAPEKRISSSLPMTPAVCASIQVSAAVQLLTGRKSVLDSTLLTGSLSDMSVDLIHFGD